MADYISREAAVKLLTNIALEVPDSKSRTVAKCINKIELMPATDVEPVRHGRWESYEENDEDFGYMRWTKCSLCRGSIGSSGGLRYCPNCGAKMDLEDKPNDD